MILVSTQKTPEQIDGTSFAQAAQQVIEKLPTICSVVGGGNFLTSFRYAVVLAITSSL